MSSCLPIPPVVIPPLPAGLSIPIPSIPGPSPIDYCCQLPPIPPFFPSISVPPFVFGTAVMTAVNAQIKLLQAWIDSLQLPCPKE